MIVNQMNSESQFTQHGNILIQERCHPRRAVMLSRATKQPGKHPSTIVAADVLGQLVQWA